MCHVPVLSRAGRDAHRAGAAQFAQVARRAADETPWAEEGFSVLS
jgi:hypothetical protein